MGLRLTFNLVLGLATIAGLAIASFFMYGFLQQNARAEVLDRARIMMQSAIAVRGYTVQEIRPLLALQQKRQFLPQTVPAYGARQYVTQLQKEYPEYSYREATLNPTNPADRASDWEADIVNWFRNHEGETELIGERQTPTGPALYLGRPIKIGNPDCLTCHTSPAEAPPTMIEAYGPSNGFGWKLNEIVGAQLVSVPMSLPLQHARQTFVFVSGILVAVFVLVVVLLKYRAEPPGHRSDRTHGRQGQPDQHGRAGGGGTRCQGRPRNHRPGAVLQPHAPQPGQRRENAG